MLPNNEENALAIPDELDWSELIDEVADLVDMGDLPSKALEAVPYLMAGLPKAEVARIVHVTRPTISNWLRQYPAMQIAVSRGKELAQQYRLSMLEGQFIQALRVSEQILGLEMTGKKEVMGEDAPEEEQVNSKLVTAMGQHARYILGLFVSSKHDLTITHEVGDSVLEAKKDALDYLAHVMSSPEGDEPIDVTYRVIDANVHNEGPMLKANGEPNFGTLGEFVTDPEIGTQCHDCGQFYQSLSSHIRKAMNISISAYETVYGLEPGSVSRVSP